MQGEGSAQSTIPTVSKRRGQRRLLIPILIALVLVTIIGSAGTFFFHVRDGATTKVNKTVTDRAYPGYLPGKGTLAFFDPLSQEGGSKWSSYSSNDGYACQFIGGIYRVTSADKGYFSICNAYGVFSNFAFEVQLTITQGDCGGTRFHKNNDGYLYYLRVCQDGTYRITKFASPNFIPLGEDKSSTIKTGLGQQNKIAVVASGHTMTFYINEQQTDQVQDNSFASVSIALIAYSTQSDRTDVAYRNAKLWTL
jgi:hypothetical protein